LFRYLERVIATKMRVDLVKNIRMDIFRNVSQLHIGYFNNERKGDLISRMSNDIKEIEFALNLIEINKIKVSPLFELKVKSKINSIEPLYEQKILAPLISIDLIENAFKHADLQSADAFISIVFEFKDSIFYLTVSNKISNRSPIKKEKSGIGIDTLNQRLQIIYKDNFKLDRFTEGDVYITHLKINLLEHKAKMLAAR
jgi:LytS/YehU family sensor histidine kinase